MNRPENLAQLTDPAKLLEVNAARPLPQRIHEVFLPWSTINASHTALSDSATSLTYGALPSVVDAVAAHLAEAGVRPGDRILLVAENCVALAVCLLAVSVLGAWSVTVNARLSKREIDNFSEHSGARRVLYFHETSRDALTHGQAQDAIEVNWTGIGMLLLGPLNTTAIAEPHETDTARQVAVMVYTSGTTGAPKAVMLTQKNLLFIGNNSGQVRRLTPADTVYGVLPLSHVYGLSALLVASLMAGAQLHLVPRFIVADLARALAEDGITVLHGAPAMFVRLIEYASEAGISLKAPRLRVVQSGGAPLTLPLKTAFEKTFGLVLHNGYGMTEASPSICQTRLDTPRLDCSVGQAIPGIEVRLDNSASGPAGSATANEVGDEVGELWVRGPNIMKGYYHAPELTAQTITADGWLMTGDLARIEADGAIFIVGRSKELIIRSGFNVYPVEVEQVLNAHPDVVHSAVVGREVNGNEEVIAFIETRHGSTLDRIAMNQFLKNNLSPYKIPAEIIVLEHLPAAPTGKILKHELRQLAAGRSQDRLNSPVVANSSQQ